MNFRGIDENIGSRYITGIYFTRGSKYIKMLKNNI